MLFQIQLASVLVPSPISYLPSKDGLVVANSAYEVECFRFKSMQVYTDNKVDGARDAQRDAQGETLKSDWTTVLGETVTQLVSFRNRYTRGWDTFATCD